MRRGATVKVSDRPLIRHPVALVVIIDVTLTPSRSWANKLQPSLLGLSLRLCDPAEGLGQVWHILDVLEGSPAEVSLRKRETVVCRRRHAMLILSMPGRHITERRRVQGRPQGPRRWKLTSLSSRCVRAAGLIPYGDYVVGWTEGALHAESDFYDLVEHASRPALGHYEKVGRADETLSKQHIDKPLRLYVYSSDLE